MITVQKTIIFCFSRDTGKPFGRILCTPDHYEAVDTITQDTDYFSNINEALDHMRNLEEIHYGKQRNIQQ